MLAGPQCQAALQALGAQAPSIGAWSCRAQGSLARASRSWVRSHGVPVLDEAALLALLAGGG